MAAPTAFLFRRLFPFYEKRSQTQGAFAALKIITQNTFIFEDYTPTLVRFSESILKVIASPRDFLRFLKTTHRAIRHFEIFLKPHENFYSDFEKHRKTGLLTSNLINLFITILRSYLN